MTELVFQVEEDPEGGLVARAVGASIFTEADTIEELRAGIRDAVLCHFDKPESQPETIRMDLGHDVVIDL